MAARTCVLRIEVYDSPSKVNGVRLQARITGDGTTVQAGRVLTTSLWGKLFEDLQWYLDDYIYGDAFAIDRASLVERDIQNSCRRVAVDLELDKLLSQTTCISSDHIELQIVNNADELYDLAFAFPWESLEQTGVWSTSDKSVTVSRLISSDANHSAPERDADETDINILIVLARAADNLDGRPRDIPPFVALEAITELSDRLTGNRQLSVEVARPGSWTSVKECLAKHPPGHYSLVHFDVHGGIRAKAPSLSFADPDGSGRLKKEFITTVARSLKKAQVRNVVLNACGSASNAHGAEANPAHIFLQHGVETVVGMSYRASAQAMSLFLKSFYENLVTSSSFSAATATGRRVLSDARSRSTNQQVDRDLCDYILPVLYTSRGPSMALTATGMEVDDPPALAPPLTSPYLQGRDFDMLLLENAVRKCSILCVVGAAGVGKSTLLHRASEIWEQTGLFASCVYVDLNGQNVSSLEGLLQIADSSTIAPENRLTIIDNVEDAVALSAVERKRILSKAEWERIQNYVAKQAKGKFIIVTRTAKTLGQDLLAKAQTFSLQGLHPLDSLALFRREFGTSAAQWSAEDRLSAELLLELLQHNPLAIHLMIPWIASSKLGIHKFFEALFDWEIDSEFSEYWISLAPVQYHVPALADMTRCYIQLDTCGQHMWLWIALYWNHGSGVGPTSQLISNWSLGSSGAASVAHALRLGEEHGLFITDGEPCFIRCINPIFTIWMRYGLFHALRVLRSDKTEYQGDMMHAMMATGNLRTVMGAANPLRVTFSDPMASFIPPQVQEQMKENMGHNKSFWTSDFSDALVSFKDTQDADLRLLRTREMKFNFLSAFNTLMGSSVVLDLKRMQFVELRLFWMFMQQISTPHENMIHSKRILALMQHLTSQMDISGLEDFRIESALGLLALPAQKASCSLEGASPVHRKMIELATTIFEACRARFGDKMPGIVLMYEPLTRIAFQSMEAKKGAAEFLTMEDVKPALMQISDILGKSGLPRAAQNQKSMEGWIGWLDEVSASNFSDVNDLEILRDRFESLGADLAYPFDNPFDRMSEDMKQEKEVLKRGDYLAEALHNGDPFRATRLLKPMIKESLNKYDWDKARKLLDMFWKIRHDHPSLSQSEVQDFVDLDSITRLQWELEQYSTHDTPPDGLAAAHANLQQVHSMYKDIASGSASDDQKSAAWCFDKMVLAMVGGQPNGDASQGNDTGQTVFQAARTILEGAQDNPWAANLASKYKPMLDSLDRYESAYKADKILCNQNDFAGARQHLRVVMDSLLEMGRHREESLPYHFRHVDVPETTKLRKSQLDILTAYGVGATGKALLDAAKSRSQDLPFTRRDLEPALATFHEAVQVAEEFRGLSLSEQPVGLGASVRLAHSYHLEVEIVIEVLDGNLSVALAKCGQLVNLLTAVDPHLSPIDSKKISFYRDVRARVGARHHCWEWRRLTDAFQPHQAALQLKRISHYFGEIDPKGPTDDAQIFFSVGISMAVVTGKQLVIQKALGAKMGKLVWQTCRASLDIYRDDLFQHLDPFTVMYFQGFTELVAADVD